MFRQRNQTPNGYLSNDVEFDNMGRSVKSFNPYTVNGLNDNRPGDIKFRKSFPVTVLAERFKADYQTYHYNCFVQRSVTSATDQTGKSRRQIAETAWQDNKGRRA